MDKITIYHNGICSKSKGALELLQDSGVPFDVRWYMTDLLTIDELAALTGKMGMQPAALIRKNEPAYMNLYAGKDLTPHEWLQAMANDPALIERPIVVCGDKAIIARPPERVLEFIK